MPIKNTLNLFSKLNILISYFKQKKYYEIYIKYERF